MAKIHITTLLGTDNIGLSRTTINSNFKTIENMVNKIGEFLDVEDESLNVNKILTNEFRVEDSNGISIFKIENEEVTVNGDMIVNGALDISTIINTDFVETQDNTVLMNPGSSTIDFGEIDITDLSCVFLDFSEFDENASSNNDNNNTTIVLGGEPKEGQQIYIKLKDADLIDEFTIDLSTLGNIGQVFTPEWGGASNLTISTSDFSSTADNFKKNQIWIQIVYKGNDSWDVVNGHPVIY